MRRLWDRVVSERVHDLVARSDLAFNEFGYDRYGVSREHVERFYSIASWFYEVYFNVKVHNADQIPANGPALLIGNHSGGVPFDAALVLTSLLREIEPPRVGHAMVEKFASSLPIVSTLYSRIGQIAGLPEHAVRFLNEGRVVVVFPEGIRGIGKLYEDRYKLARFGTGFLRIALAAGAPIIPFAFIGAEEAFPVRARLERLGRAVGVPFLPIPEHLIPFPVPFSCSIHYGAPMEFQGDGTEVDEVVVDWVEQVRERVGALIESGRAERRARLREGFSTEEGDV